MRMRTRMKRTSSRSTSVRIRARASSLVLGLLLLLAACASFDGHNLVPGQSTVNDVVSTMGQPADKRIGPQGETIYWYPQLPWGHASYAALISPDDHTVRETYLMDDPNFTAKDGCCRRH